jgi:spermidine synthase
LADAATPHARVVVDAARPTGRTLVLDGVEASYVDLADPTHLEFAYVRRLADVVDAAAPANRPLEVLHLGGGGCTLPRYVAATRPGSRAHVVELHPEVARLARDELGAAMRIRTGDARAAVEGSPRRHYDIVIADVFHGPVVPRHMTTREFLDQVRRVLRPAGVYAVNLIDEKPLRAARRATATIIQAFPETVLTAPRAVLAGRRTGNLVLAAAARTLPVARLRKASTDWDLLDREQTVAWCGEAKPLRD